MSVFFYLKKRLCFCRDMEKIESQMKQKKKNHTCYTDTKAALQSKSHFVI